VAQKGKGKRHVKQCRGMLLDLTAWTQLDKCSPNKKTTEKKRKVHERQRKKLIVGRRGTRVRPPRSTGWTWEGKKRPREVVENTKDVSLDRLSYLAQLYLQEKRQGRGGHGEKMG